MALSNRLVANAYAKNGNQFDSRNGAAMGRLNYFPNSGNLFYAAPTGTVFAGVTCNSIIEVLPTGLNQISDKFYCVETVAQLVTNGI